MHTNDRSSKPSNSAIDDPLGKLIRDRQLIFISNRQPYRHSYEDDDTLSIDRPTGGLTASLDPIMQQTGGTWIAWGDGDGDFDVIDTDGYVSVPPDDPSYRLKRLWLSDNQIRDYYYGFSNQVLWPICHTALTEVRCDPTYWQTYREVNEQFAEAVSNHTDGQPLVWFQDYHLALAPKLARPSLPDSALLRHFWHIPWPSWDTYRALPNRFELLEGMLGNDLIAFHTSRYKKNFLECIDAVVDDATTDLQAGTISYHGRIIDVKAIPMGVPKEQIKQSASTNKARAFWSSFTQKYSISAGTQSIVGVDRLDYTKGIVERLKALEHLLDTQPNWRHNLTYIQNSSESRTSIPAYEELQEEVVATVSRINHRFGTDDWQPIIHLTDWLSREELYSLYRNADLALVTSIRDGMNLVAQEYVAAQRNNDGVLVLSDQTGIHDQLGDHTLTVSPFNITELATMIDKALTLPSDERRLHMNHLNEWIRTHDLKSWLKNNFLAAMKTKRLNPRSTSTT